MVFRIPLRYVQIHRSFLFYRLITYSIVTNFCLPQTYFIINSNIITVCSYFDAARRSDSIPSSPADFPLFSVLIASCSSVHVVIFTLKRILFTFSDTTGMVEVLLKNHLVYPSIIQRSPTFDRLQLPTDYHQPSLLDNHCVVRRDGNRYSVEFISFNGCDYHASNWEVNLTFK